MSISSMPFGWPVVLYLTLAALASGTSFWAFLAYRSGEVPRARRGFLLAALAIMAGACCLVVDLESPAAFGLILTQFNTGSVISWGARLIVLFALAAAICWLLLRDTEGHPRRARGFAELTALLGLGVGLYPGWVLYQATGRPIWGSLLLAPLFLASALSMGRAALQLTGGGGEEPVAAGKIEIFLLGMQAVLLVGWLAGARVASPEGAARIVQGDLAPLLWLGVVIVGIVLPIIGLRQKSPGLVLLGLAPLLGGFALRALVVLGGQGPAAFIGG